MLGFNYNFIGCGEQNNVDLEEQTANSVNVAPTKEEVLTIADISGNPTKKKSEDMENNPEGQTILQKSEKAAKFDQFPAEQSLAQMQELYQWTQTR
jgi:hypothetical protein